MGKVEAIEALRKEWYETVKKKEECVRELWRLEFTENTLKERLVKYGEIEFQHEEK